MPPSLPFEKFYNEVLKESVDSLENSRLAAKRWLLLSLLPLALGIVLFIYAGNEVEMNGRSGFIFFAVLCLLGAGIFYYVYQTKRKKYVAAFKEAVIRKIINFINPSFEY